MIHSKHTFDVVNVSSIQLAIQLQVFEQWCRRVELISSCIYQFLPHSQHSWVHLKLSFIASRNIFYLVNGFSIHLAIQFQVFDDKSSGIHLRVLKHCHFTLYSGVPRNQEHLGLPGIYLETFTYWWMSESLPKAPWNSQALSGTPRCSQVLTKFLVCPKGL